MSTFNSRAVNSNQQGTHRLLSHTVKKHLNTEYKKPYQQHNLQAYQQFIERLNNSHYSRLILDSCCGTGMSTKLLAQNSPDALVVGIDQSAHRLHKAKQSHPANCLFLQTNCEDFWRLCLANSNPSNQNLPSSSPLFDEHYILYPNPWPKSDHLKRRWHGHPVFPTLPRLAQKTTVRSNWKTYLDEFAHAWKIVTHQPVPVVKLTPLTSYTTLFEQKYAKSSQDLYEIIADFILIKPSICL